MLSIFHTLGNFIIILPDVRGEGILRIGIKEAFKLQVMVYKTRAAPWLLNYYRINLSLCTCDKRKLSLC